MIGFIHKDKGRYLFSSRIFYNRQLIKQSLQGRMTTNKSSLKFKNKCGNSFCISFSSFKYRSIITSQSSNAIKEFLDDTFSYNIPLSRNKSFSIKISGTSNFRSSTIIRLFHTKITHDESFKANKQGNARKGKRIIFCIFVKTF